MQSVVQKKVSFVKHQPGMAAGLGWLAGQNYSLNLAPIFFAEPCTIRDSQTRNQTILR